MILFPQSFKAHLKMEKALAADIRKGLGQSTMRTILFWLTFQTTNLAAHEQFTTWKQTRIENQIGQIPHMPATPIYHLRRVPVVTCNLSHHNILQLPHS